MNVPRYACVPARIPLASLWLFYPAVALLCGSVLAAPAPGDTVVLSPGQAKAITLEADAESALVGDPQTADVAVIDARHLVVIGKTAGITTIDVRGIGGVPLGAYAVRVDAQTDHANQVVAHLAGDETDIHVDAVGENLFVSGTARGPAQAARILEGVRTVASGEVVDGLRLTTPAQVSLEVLISEVSRTVTDELGIDWSVDMNPFADVAEWVWGTGVRLGTGALQVGEMITQEIQRAGPDGYLAFEVETDELGVQLPVPRGGDGGIVLSKTHEVNSGKYHLTGFLDALAQNGLVTVHARPSLTTVSGEPAAFYSGLEVPVPTITDRGLVGTVYEKTGVELTFTPTVLSGEQISLTVDARVRELAPGGASIAGTHVSNISERSAATTVELGDGQSIAIAGLYRRTTLSSEGGIPLLKDIPVWGALFGSTTERDDSAELIIVVTPTIVAGVSADVALAARPAAAAAARRIGTEFHY